MLQFSEGVVANSYNPVAKLDRSFVVNVDDPQVGCFARGNADIGIGPTLPPLGDLVLIIRCVLQPVLRQGVLPRRVALHPA